MIRHSVYFWLDDSLSDEQKQQFEGGLKALFDIDGVRRGNYAIAAETPERPVTDNTYDFALFLNFTSVEDHNAYQDHPDHHVFVEKFSPWFAKVKVFDAEME